MNHIVVDNIHIQPSKIVCVGRNYVEHILELKNEIPEQTVIFIKPNSAICTTLHSGTDEAVHYESELSFLIKDGQAVAVAFGLDLTKRELQSQLKSNGLPWERAKAFNRSAVFSQFARFTGDLQELSLELLINGKLTQYANIDLMITKPQQLIEEVNTFMALDDGDILMTGTPKGVGELRVNDYFVGRIYAGDKLLIEEHWIVK